MSRIFWDTMLFIYLLEGNQEFIPQVRSQLMRSYERGDALLTSCFAVGEVMVGGAGDRAISSVARRTIEEMGFSFLPFVEGSIDTFAHLRSVQQLKAADSINLACASAAGVDMFLTNDNQLLKRGLRVPGIHFIVDFNLSVL